MTAQEKLEQEGHRMKTREDALLDAYDHSYIWRVRECLDCSDVFLLTSNGYFAIPEDAEFIARRHVSSPAEEQP